MAISVLTVSNIAAELTEVAMRNPERFWPQMSTDETQMVLICGNLCPSVAKKSKLVLAFGEKKLVGAVVIRLGNEDIGQSVQIAVVGLAGVNEFLRGGDAVFFQHDDEHLRVDDRAGVKPFHKENLTTDGHG